MRLLLDTQTFLWWINDDKQLPASARSALAKNAMTVFSVTVSCWEMAIKPSLGKLRLTKPIERFIPEELSPFHHRDPFDRILVAQSLTEKDDHCLKRHCVF